MSAAARRRPPRRRAAGTRRRRRPTNENEEPEIQVIREEASTCIDLTRADDNDTHQVVDLTSVIDSPIVILSSTSTPGSTRNTRSRPRRNLENLSIASDSSSDSELEELTFSLEGTPPKKLRDTASDENSAGPAPSCMVSPEGRIITCPICFDTDKQIKASKKKIFSTNCGHIFCSECIKGAIRSQKKCPTCRKALTMKQIHPLFL